MRRMRRKKSYREPDDNAQIDAWFDEFVRALAPEDTCAEVVEVLLKPLVSEVSTVAAVEAFLEPMLEQMDAVGVTCAVKERPLASVLIIWSTLSLPCF